ncbi:MAG TPA: hypothetical protein VLD67_04520 [Vicinamibacterales bacterium]|nr:hypothetical protein [Vicinamibacterales bacterium]
MRTRSFLLALMVILALAVLALATTGRGGGLMRLLASLHGSPQ